MGRFLIGLFVVLCVLGALSERQDTSLFVDSELSFDQQVQAGVEANLVDDIRQAREAARIQRLLAPVAENGSRYGDISSRTGRPKIVAVKGYYRSDGTYVRGHYRSLPR